MAVTSTTGLDTISQVKNPSKSNISATTLGADFQTYLKLLTTQLQNQDPTSPLDTNQFTQQLASLSNVEQSIQINKNLETLIAGSGSTQLNTAVGFIGKVVEATGNQSLLVNKEAAFIYELPAGAKTAEVSILNEQGQVVFTGTGTNSVGRNIVTWDGVNSVTGANSPDGVYKIVVKAKDNAGKDMGDVVTRTVGRVTSVDVKDGKSIISIGTIAVPIDQVLSVKDALSS